MKILVLAAIIAVGQAQNGPPPAAAPLAAYVPQRVFDTRQKAFGDFESMLADLARADVVFVGEQHDDPNTHRLELAILEGLIRRRIPVVVALEMFERDVQPSLDRYLAGTLAEEQFLKESRPWPRYATDYRPIVEFARAHRLEVVASEVPRRIAGDVSKNGLGVLDALGADRALAARDLQCPTTGDYYRRFLEAMGGHGTTGDAKPAEVQARNDRFYLAQCLKDETMAESLAQAFERAAGRPTTIVHFNGAFHSDYAQGAAEAARRRLPGRRIAVVTIVPVSDLDRERPDAKRQQSADYVVYTIK